MKINGKEQNYMKLSNFWENLILVCIILVVLLTLLDEYSRYQHWNLTTKIIILVFSLIFDIIFTIEFITRTVLAKKKIRLYLLYQRGWVDFLSSIPLLLLNSGPSFILMITGRLEEGAATIGVLNVLKVVKAIRVTRVLRLIRIMKIFGKIHNTESKMAQHHTAVISTTAVCTIITVLIFFAIFLQNPFEQSINMRKENYTNLIKNIENITVKKREFAKGIASKIFPGDKNILKAEYKKKVLYASISDKRFKDYYNFENHVKAQSKNFLLYISIVDINKQIAFNNMKTFFIIIFVVIAFMVIYTRHFVQNISDIVHIMKNGLTDKNYNLQVKIREEFESHEIFKLAQYYNEVFLAKKIRNKHEDKLKRKTMLTMDDLADFKK